MYQHYLVCLVVVWLIIVVICFVAGHKIFTNHLRKSENICGYEQEAHDLLNNTEISDEEFKKQLSELRDKTKGFHVW